jgi:hypothetical protein
VAGVQIRCPNSGLWAWTDVDVDPTRWDPASLSGRQLHCKICGDPHLASSRGLRIPDWTESSLTQAPHAFDAGSHQRTPASEADESVSDALFEPRAVGFR